MKIAMIGSRGIPFTYSGIETHLEQLCPRLVKKGLGITVYGKINERFPYRKFKGVRIQQLPAVPTKHLETISRSALSVYNELFSENDIVHFHALGPSILAFLPRAFRKRTVVTVHGLDWQRAKWGRFATACLKAGEWASVNFCDATICVSRQLKQYYIDKYGADAKYVPNGVEVPKRKSPHKIQAMGLRKENYILFLSRLVPEKGAHYLINAFKRIKTEMKLVIAGGPGHTQAYVEEIKAMAAGDHRIIFTGFVSGNTLVELFSNAYLFVLPSEMEGLPIALLEALSYGRCVVTSDIPENLEVSADHGFAFKNRDASSLKSVLVSLLKDPVLVKQTGDMGRAMVQKAYNWDLITDQTIDVYRNILN